MSRGVLILLGLAVALGGYLAWDLNSEKKETARKEEQAVLFPFVADQVNELKIERKDLTMRITRSEDGWRIVEPINDQADNDYTDDVVTRLVQEKSIDVAKQGPEIDAKVFGFDEPAGTLTLVTQAGESKSYEVSNKTNFEQNAFIREKGGDKVLVAAGTWPLSVGRGPLDFRNKKMFRGRIAAVDQLDIRNQFGVTRLVSKEGVWTVSDQPEWEIDQNRVREILSMINETRVDDFILDRAPRPDEKAKLGLTKPAVTIRALVGEEAWTAEFGRSKEGLPHVHVSSPEFVLRMDSAGYQKFDQIEAVDLRDKRLPFDFDKDQTRKIELKTSLKTGVLAKVGSEWSLQGGDPSMSVDSSRIETMIKNLRESSATRYGERRPKSPPVMANTLKLTAEDGTLLFEMNWSDPQVRKIGDRDANVRWAKTNKHRDHFWFEESSLERLGLAELFGPRSESADGAKALE